jgi:hypothetical protein
MPENMNKAKNYKQGRRPGAGRPKGSRNKKSRATIRDEAAYLKNFEQRFRVLPLDYMLCVMNDEEVSPERRDAMAKAAAPYFHPRLSALDITATTQKPAKHTIDVRKLNDDELLQLEQIVAKAGTIISEEPDSEFDEPVPVGYLPITAKSGRRH